MIMNNTELMNKTQCAVLELQKINYKIDDEVYNRAFMIRNIN